MNTELKSDLGVLEMNFKRPCWLALCASLGALAAGYGVYYGIFPLGAYDADRWRRLLETGSFLLLTGGLVGFAASLIWWLVAAIVFRFRNSHRRSVVALAPLCGLGLVAAFCLCGGNLQAQDDNGGGPGGPPPGQPGDDGPGGPGDAGGPGGPPGNFGNGGSGGPGGNFDPAQFQQRMLDQIRQDLSLTNSDEWAAVQPLIQKVMDARRAVGFGGAMGFGPGGPGGLGGRGRPGPQASAEQQALQNAITADAPLSQIKDALAKCRAARADHQAKLAAAQVDLKNVLSLKQEAQAVLLGLLP